MGKIYPLIEATCRDCGKVVQITSNSSGRFRRCKECKKIQKRAYAHERDMRRSAERRQMQPTRNVSDYSIGGDFHITKDPDGSWGFNSSFTFDEIERMLSMGYLTSGTEFAKEPSRVSTHRIIKVSGVYMMRLISEIVAKLKKQPGPRSIPKNRPKLYWRTKKLCHSTTA